MRAAAPVPAEGSRAPGPARATPGTRAGGGGTTSRESSRSGSGPEPAGPDGEGARGSGRGGAGDTGGARTGGGQGKLGTREARRPGARGPGSPANGGAGLTPRRQTLSSRMAIMSSGPGRTGAQHPPEPRRAAPRQLASSGPRLPLAQPAGGSAAAAISGPPAAPRRVTWPPPAPPGAAGKPRRPGFWERP